ncbi:MAG: AMP-binding protein [Oscillospiraceae bacterium]|nr:AMP-binding protein [Oscillospiraceae bacterium]
MLLEVARRIRELRIDCGYGQAEMAELTGLPVEKYCAYEAGEADLPFTFIHKCAQILGVEMMELLEGQTPHLTGYAVTRRGGGQITAREPGIEIRSIASTFRDRKADPYWVRYSYSEAEQRAPIPQVTHEGQEFDMVIEGRMKIKVGEHTELLGPGDSIFYNSSTPHGMIAVDGSDVVFLALILSEEGGQTEWDHGHPKSAVPVEPVRSRSAAAQAPDYLSDFLRVSTDENGTPSRVRVTNAERFNFAFDVVDAIAEKEPERLAMLHIDREKRERRFTFEDMRKKSARAANYFRALGVEKGDRVMLVLRRNWEFWPIIVGLHKLGAVAIPATDQLLEKDFEYRFQAADVTAVVCTAYGESALHAENAMRACPGIRLKVMCGGRREGWHDFDGEYEMYSSRFHRDENSICGDDTMLMLFSSGTTGYPKAVMHSCKYPLGHYVTAKYWHCVNPDGLHFTISETGWGKALWGKLYGQWMCSAATFVYDFDRFHADDIMPMFAKYNITTFCAPPTMYRFFIKEDLGKYDLSSIRHASTAGEALNPEVFARFREATGLSIMEAFGQTETTLTIGTFTGMSPRPGSMGKPNPLYEVALLGGDGKPAAAGETGEICISVASGATAGLFTGYLNNPAATAAAIHDGWYHTGDLAWRDEDGYYWYVGRADDVIKSSGYRIGPFEIESVIMELPYVLECGVSAEPDEVRGQVIKASIVLVRGTEGSEELKKEIQDYVKRRTAPYKYPRIIVFREDLPKTISGKIIRNQL